MSSILLVDDARLIRRALGRLLSRDHRVRIAESGEEALELLSADADVDVILADVSMPGIGGVGLYAELPEALRRRVILMTGESTAGPFRHRVVVTHPEAPVLRKPFYMQDLQKAISTVLARQQPAHV